MVEPLPKHIGIILDGNRRFSKKLMLKPWMGHEWGAKKVEKLIGWTVELGIKELTLYAFSVENFNRPKEEFDYLMNIFRKEFDSLKDDKRIEENGIRINIIGRIKMFPEDIQEKMDYIMKKTENNSNFIMNFAMAYGGRAEIIDATKKIAKQIELGTLKIDEINEQIFSRNLYIESEPDFIIRTSGEKRTSGFMLWQGSYAEYLFMDKFWPEFEKEDLVNAIQEYMGRERRFGKR